ncbi:ABC transporter permease [Sinosporangium siamense]|uniref:Amino acid ABC transporter permease n=1 Tax=Sinosporangium siamense TaxID=1367973 RepID=A0A919V577_9ACTN|nr:ABC transporter permease [Sinosporangium siamense]GII90541.1 amino acid ABC transporter permease [Sinosporangium siamense]
MKLVKRYRTPLIAVADLVVFVLVWHVAVVNLELVNRLFFPSPGDVLAALGDLIAGGVLATQLATSATSWAVGYVLGAAAGVLTGLIAGSVNAVNRLVMPLLWSLWATPLIALQPTLTAWLDYGSGPIIVLVFLSTMIPVALNTATGALSVKKSLLRAGQVFGCSQVQLYLKVRLPWVVPYMLGGFRLAVPTSMIGLLVGEMVGSPTGLGSIIVNATSRFRTGEAFAAIAVYVVLSVALVKILDTAERRVGRWRTG